MTERREAVLDDGLPCALVTATRDRQSDLENDPADPAWDDRPAFGLSRGLPWWGAVVLAAGLSTVAAVVDMQRSDTLQRFFFQAAYLVGCVVAIAWVRRRSVFTAMVQPPLVFAVVFLGSYLLFKDAPKDGYTLQTFAIDAGVPLANNFPTMAITTALVVAIGVARLFLQRNPDPTVRPSKAAAEARPRKERPAKERVAKERPARERPAREPRPERGEGRGRRPARDAAGDDAPPARERGRRTPPLPPEGRERQERPTRAARPSRSERGDRQPPPPERRKPDRTPPPERGERPRRPQGGTAGRPTRGEDPRRSGRPMPPRRRPPEDRDR